MKFVFTDKKVSLPASSDREKGSINVYDLVKICVDNARKNDYNKTVQSEIWKITEERK